MVIEKVPRLPSDEENMTVWRNFLATTMMMFGWSIDIVPPPYTLRIVVGAEMTVQLISRGLLGGHGRQ